jgi:hypothetical protein
MGTSREHSENTLGTREKRKKILPHPNLKGKKSRHLACMHGLLIPKEFVTTFGLG